MEKKQENLLDDAAHDMQLKQYNRKRTITQCIFLGVYLPVMAFLIYDPWKLGLSVGYPNAVALIYVVGSWWYHRRNPPPKREGEDT